MKKSIFVFCIVLLLAPVILKAVSSYEELVSREKEPYLLHNTESVSFNGQIWARQYGMKEYYVTPRVKDIQSYMLNLKANRNGSGGYQLIKVELTDKNSDLLAEYQVSVPEFYPKNHINVLIPSYYAEELIAANAAVPVDEFKFNQDSIVTDRTNRQVIYEEGFEENLGNEYDFQTYIDSPNLLYRNLAWGIVDCESYEDEQSLWCVADLSGPGWYNSPPDPCSHYENWTWNFFVRTQTIDVTVAEELVFEYFSQFSLDSSGMTDYFRVWVIDYPATDWQMIGEYTGNTQWTDMQLEIEDYTNFAYYFEFESGDLDYASGIYVDNVSIYNMVPNLTWGENSIAEYPYDYSPETPHNLRILYEIFNDSNADVDDAFSTDVLISVDADYTTEDDNYLLETVELTNGLDSEEVYSEEIVVNLDEYQTTGGESLPPGSYHVMFMVDCDEDIEEYDEEDNLWLPDGTFDFGNVNLTFGAGSTFTYPAVQGTTQLEITAEVVNTGTEASTVAFVNGFLISIDNDLLTTGDNYDLGYVDYPDPIAAGGSSTQILTVDLTDFPDIPAEDFWVFYVIDVYANVNEADEYDNIWISNSQFTYSGLPYLEVEPLTLEFDFMAASQNLFVSSNTSWNASENAEWLTLSSDSGDGDAVIAVEVTNNIITEPRSTVITFTGADETINVTVNQLENSNVIYGDIDGSTIVDAYDASLVLQFVVGINTGIDPFPEINANVDGEGDISAYDASLILQYAVGIIEQFPVETVSRIIDSE